MAKIIAFVNATRKSLITFQQTHVQAIWVSPFSSWTADLLAFMALAFFAHIANFVTDVHFRVFNLFSSHDFFFKVIRIVHCVASNVSGVSATSTWLLSHTITSFTLT